MNSIGAHLTAAAVPISRWIEQARTARYRTIQIQADAGRGTPGARASRSPMVSGGALGQ